MRRKNNFIQSMFILISFIGIAALGVNHSVVSHTPAKLPPVLANLLPSQSLSSVSTISSLKPNTMQATTLLPVIHKSGTLTSNQTWSNSSAYIIDSSLTIPANITLTIPAGTIVKFSQGINGIIVAGTLKANGTLASPAVFTSTRDDSVGGDSNNDGSTTLPSSNDYNNLISMSFAGKIIMNYSVFTYAQTDIYSDTSASVTVNDSSFTNSSQAVNLAYNTSGSIASFRRNQFNVISSAGAPAVSLLGVDDLTAFVLNGTNQNVFNNSSTVSSKTVSLAYSKIPVGLTWAVATTSNVTLKVDSTFAVSGTLSLGSGVVFSTQQLLQINGSLLLGPGTIIKYVGGGGITIPQGGTIKASGTAASPTVFTSLQDDSVGGDTNGDGTASSPHAGDYIEAIFNAGGTITISHAIFHYGGHALSSSCGGAGAVNVQDSTLYGGVVLEGCNGTLPVLKRNHFMVDSGYAIQASSLNPSSIILNGADKNILTGTGQAITVYIMETTIPSGSTWSIEKASGATLLTNSLQLNGVMNINAGVVVKSSGYGITVTTGATLNVTGTSASPVLFTSYKDDSVAGDSEGAPSTVGAINDYVSATTGAGGRVVMTHSVVSYAGLAIQGSFSDGTSFTDNLLNSAVRTSSFISMKRNTFNITSGIYVFALDASYSQNPSGIILAGADTNIFPATGRNTVVLYDADIPHGYTMTVDNTSEAVILPQQLNVEGVLNLKNGALVKATGIDVNSGGIVQVTGTTSAPVIFTSSNDDSIGGDTNLDGPTVGSPQDKGTMITNYGGTVNVSHAIFRYSELAVADINNANITTIKITDSLLQSPVIIASPTLLTLQRNKFDILNRGAYSAALSVFGTSDISGVALSGIDKNTFIGSGSGKIIAMNNVILPAGKTWSVDGASGAILYGAILNVYGVLNMNNGAIFKVPEATAINVQNGGVVNVAGTTSKPVIFTSYKDDSVGGDSNADGPSSALSNFRGQAFDVEVGGSLNMTNSVIERLGEAVGINGGQALFNSTTIQYVGSGIYVPKGIMSYRGTFKDVEVNSIAACDWMDLACGVDAAYTDWGNSSGPSNVCGKVLTNPWKYNGVTRIGFLFGSDNCGSSTNPYQELHNSGETFAEALEYAKVKCDSDFPDACTQRDRMLTCMNGAVDIANHSSTPFPLSGVGSIQDAKDFAGLLNGNATEYIKGKVLEIVAPPEVSNMAGYLKEMAELFSSMKKAFDSCR